MTLKRALELMKIEKKCIKRNKDQKCNRECEKCDLVQNTDELLEAYKIIIHFVSTNLKISKEEKRIKRIKEKHKYLKMLSTMQTNINVPEINCKECKNNRDSYCDYWNRFLYDEIGCCDKFERKGKI